MGDLSLERRGVTDVGAYKKALPRGAALRPGDVACAAISLAVDPQWAACSGQVYRSERPSMTGDPRAERQYRILLALRSTDWVSAQSLAEKLDVSIRTIYRDIEDLLSCGIPIEGLRGPDGGYRLRPGVAVDPALLSSVDSFALSVERSRNVPVPETQLPETPEALRNRVFFDNSDWFMRRTVRMVPAAQRRRHGVQCSPV